MELERLITSPGVDWTEKLLNRSGYCFKPIPVISKNSPIYPVILLSIDKLQALMVQATPKEIFPLLGRLRIHFGTMMMSENENKVFIRDYISDLVHFPLDLIELVCNEYRYDPNSNGFPSIAKLLARLNKHLYTRALKLNRLKALVEVSERNENKDKNNQ